MINPVSGLPNRVGVVVLCCMLSTDCTSRRTGLSSDQSLCISAFIKHLVQTALVSNTRVKLESSLLMQGKNSKMEEHECRGLSPSC